MCDTCGCALPPHQHGPATRTVELHARLLADNDQRATHNRAHLNAHGVVAINLMSSPGAGKTLLLEQTIRALHGEISLAVIEGDLETDNDARRIRALGVAAHQINTGSACHLDALLVHNALHHLELDGVELLFIENVGNLVCPATYDLGQHANVVLLAVTEGDDKPAKYPVMFRAADLVLVSKSDLLPHVGEFDPHQAEAHLRQLASPAPLFTLSARSGAGMQAWLGWLREQLRTRRQTPRPHDHPPHDHE